MTTMVHDVPSVVASARERLAGQRFIVARGQYCGEPGAERVTIVTWQGRAAWDGLVRRDTLPTLDVALACIGSARKGQVDTMHATPWSRAWTTDGMPLVVLDHQGPLVEVAPPDLHVRGRPPIPLGAVARVEARISADWTNRWIDIVLRSGDRIEAAREEDSFPLVDPTYDGLNLMADTAWVTSLARPLAESLAVELRVDEDLR